MPKSLFMVTARRVRQEGRAGGGEESGGTCLVPEIWQERQLLPAVPSQTTRLTAGVAEVSAVQLVHCSQEWRVRMEVASCCSQNGGPCGAAARWGKAWSLSVQPTD